MSDETGEAVRQWRGKAQSDWTTVEILLSSERCPADTVCFDCQQSVEKLLKPRWSSSLNLGARLSC